MNRLFAQQHRLFGTRRSGITLTEVLISIAVAGVGMFGVFVLIPFSARQAELGQVYDQAAAISRTAVAKVECFEMADPDKWRRTGTVSVQFPANVIVTPDNDTDGIFDWRQSSFCLDPRALVVDSTNVLFPAAAVSGDTPRTAGKFSIERITYSDVFGPNQEELRALASLFFQTNDDIVMKDPEDKQFFPNQTYESNGTSNLSRASNGTMSWMVMFEPEPETTASNTYRMYVVVFKNRNLSNLATLPEELVIDPYVDTVATPLTTTPPPTLTNFVTFHSTVIALADTALAGGDLTIVKRIPEGYEVRRNDWIMLQSQFKKEVFAWYRVVRADFDITTSETHLTLSGGDWPLNLPSDTPAGLGIPRIVFIPEVVMVYEKTIKLGNDSMFSSN